MKKGFLPVALLVGCTMLHALDWRIPTVALRYEVSDGSQEDPDPDEETLVPASLRHTVVMRVAESADPVDMGLNVSYSAKDYLLQKGDYSYIALGQDAKAALSRAVDLGFSASQKWITFTDPAVYWPSSDFLALRGKLTADVDVAKGQTLELYLAAQYDLHTAPERTRQNYAAVAGFSSRLGGWQPNARYRGELRLPMGASSAVAQSLNHIGSLSLKWDPNR